MDIWCVNTTEKVESIRTIFLATLRAVTASAGILCACNPGILDRRQPADKMIKLICKAGHCPGFDEHGDLLELVQKTFVPKQCVYEVEKSESGKKMLILCSAKDGEIHGIMVLFDTKGNDEVLRSLGKSIGTLCVGVMESFDAVTSKVYAGDANIHSVHGMVMEAQRLYEKSMVANQAQDTFLANMSHELRGPLHNIIGMTRLLEDSENLSPQQREYLDVIDHCGVQLLNIIGDILDYSKLVAGAMPLKPTNFCPRKLVENSIDVVLYRAREKGLDITYSLSKHVAETLFADGKRIQQILVNLLSNSVKFTEFGKVHVTVSISDEEDPDPASKSAMLHVMVEDTGIGIPRRYHNTVFKTFTQIDHARAQKLTEGSGLGLAIVKKLLHMMKGRITLFSRSAEDGYAPDTTGTEVHFYIPVEEVPAMPESSDSSQKSSSASEVAIKKLLKRKYVLLYDEEVNSRVQISGMLIAWGALVLSCSTAHEVDMYLNTQTLDIRLCIVYCSNRSQSEETTAPRDPAPIGWEHIPTLIEEAIGPCPVIEMYSDPKMCVVEKNSSQINRLCKPIKKTALRSAIQNCLSMKDCLRDRTTDDCLLGKTSGDCPYSLRSRATAERSEGSGEPKSTLTRSKTRRLGERLRVLVVEDNADSRLVAIGYLKKIDPTMIVHTASDGQEAIDRVIRASGSFDLILMDIRMPRINGLEATKKIRSIVKRDIYIVAFTATVIQHEIHQKVPGEVPLNYFDATIGKPVMIEELESIVKLVRQRKAGSA